MVVVTMLSACGSGESRVNDPALTTPAINAERDGTPQAGPPVLGPIVWATGVNPSTNQPDVVVTELPPAAPVVYAVMEVVILPAGTELQAHWSFNDTSLDALSSAVEIPTDRTSGWVEFHLQQNETGPWPDGRFQIIVRSGETVLQQAEIPVVPSSQ